MKKNLSLRGPCCSFFHQLFQKAGQGQHQKAGEYVAYSVDDIKGQAGGYPRKGLFKVKAEKQRLSRGLQHPK